MSTETTNSNLTAGQQGVMAMYAKEIARYKAQRDAAHTAFVAGEDTYEDYRYYRDHLDTIENERDMVLAQFQTAV